MFVHHLVPPSGCICALRFDFPTMATLDARGHLAWTSLGIIFFLRASCSKFSSVIHVQSSVQFSLIAVHALRFDIPVAATLDARGHLAWTSLGIIFFLRSSRSQFDRACAVCTCHDTHPWQPHAPQTPLAWHGMAEVCEGAPVAVSGWVLTDRHDLRPCAASSLHRATMSVSNVIGGT